jgi:hypothetical protein
MALLTPRNPTYEEVCQRIGIDSDRAEWLPTSELCKSSRNREESSRLERAVQLASIRNNQVDSLEENGPGGLKELQGRHAAAIKIQAPDAPNAQALLVAERMSGPFLSEFISKVQSLLTLLDAKSQAGKLGLREGERKLESDLGQAVEIHSGRESSPAGATPAIMTPRQETVLAREETR